MPTGGAVSTSRYANTSLNPPCLPPVDVHHPDMGSALKPAYRYLTGWASGLARAATSAGRRLRGVGRHREEDKGD